MSEFSDDQAEAWMQISLNRNVTIQDAIYWDLFFECKKDPQKFTRAVKFFCVTYGMALPEGFPS